MYKYVVFFSILFVIFAVVMSKTVGLFDNLDGFSYLGIAEYLVSGKIQPIAPFNGNTPRFLNGPVYGLVLYPLMSNFYPHTMSIVTFFQFMLLLGANILLSLSVAKLINKTFMIIGFILFFFMPFVLMYATVLWAEVLILFLFSLYIFVLVDVLQHKKSLFSPWILVMLSSILFLTKFVFIPFIAFSFLLASIRTFKERKQYSLPHHLIRFLPVVIGIIPIVWWVNIVHSQTGIWDYTLHKGRQTNSYTYQYKVLPSKENPIVKEFLKRYPSYESIASLHMWEGQYFFLPEFNEQTLTERDIDQLYQQLFVETIKEHPVTFIGHVIRNHFTLVNTKPGDWHEIIAQLEQEKKGCLECNKVRVKWNNNFIGLQSTNNTMAQVWIWYLSLQSAYFPLITSILFVLAYIGLFQTIINKQRAAMIVTLMFFFLYQAHATLTSEEGRYMILTYPAYTICILYGLYSIYSHSKKIVRLVRHI